MRHYSLRTEDVNHDSCRRIILFHGKRHPADPGEPAANVFLAHLTTDKHFAASLQYRALAALLVLYEHGLGRSTG